MSTKLSNYSAVLKLLIIDDHVLFRELLIPTLEGLDTEVVIYEADSISTGLKILKGVKQIDLILLDLCFPGEHSWEIFPFEKIALDSTPILILTASMHRRDFNTALEKGCRGYITKSTGKQQLINGINSILAGQTYFSTDMLSRVKNPVDTARPGNDLSKTAIKSLSSRQNEILSHLIKGDTNREIAKSCGISEGTVKLHVSSILKVLRVSNRTQAVIKANDIKRRREI